MKQHTKNFFDGYDYHVIRAKALNTKTGETLYWVSVTGVSHAIIVHEYGGDDGYEVYTNPDHTNTVEETRAAVFGEQ